MRVFPEVRSVVPPVGFLFWDRLVMTLSDCNFRETISLIVGCRNIATHEPMRMKVACLVCFVIMGASLNEVRYHDAGRLESP